VFLRSLSVVTCIVTLASLSADEAKPNSRYILCAVIPEKAIFKADIKTRLFSEIARDV